MAKKRDEEDIKVVCYNRRAAHDYFIDEVYEAGIVLLGPEVKSLRNGWASITDSYAKIRKGEVFLYNMYIKPYPYAHHMPIDPTRPRKLLLHRKEINRLIGKTEERGYTLIPVKVYFSPRGWAKVQLALAKGKKKYDKRREIKERELKRELEKIKKRYSY